MESLSLNSLKQRWQERIANSEALHAMELEDSQREEQLKEMHIRHLRKMKAEERALRQKQVIINGENYFCVQHAYSNVKGTSPLLLDTVVTPVFEKEDCDCSSSNLIAKKCEERLRRARCERNKALFLARQYRNLAEQSQSDKRLLKSNMEEKIETVRDFWRNKIIEGDSRGGRMVRAALIRNE